MRLNKSEILLIRAYKKGNPEAFERLFERYRKKLYAFLFRMLNSKEDAEEIVQDTFVKIWDKREEFNEEHSFESFLFTIAKNSFLNLNRKKVNRKIFENYLSYIDEVSSAQSDEYVILKETRDIINSIIDGMPPKRKEIFLLSRISGLSRQIIADRLKISVSTVDGQLLKANKYFQENLKKYKLL